MNIEVNCSHSRLVPIDELKPNPKNPNDHSEDQIKAFVNILNYQGWRRPVTVSNRSGYITKGHGALLAAKRLGLEVVPVDYQDYSDEQKEISDMIADNALQRMSVLNIGKLKELCVEMTQLDSNFDLSMTALDLESLQLINEAVNGPNSLEDDERRGVDYTKKVEAPIYEPKGEKPELTELVDLSKSLALKNEINDADIPEEIKAFLSDAADRHKVFDYGKIAEYYSHASKEVQELMERSALVIIDFDKAIEEGFIRLSKSIAEVY